MKVMQNRITLSPYDPKKRLRLIIDGASTIGTGFVLCQFTDESNPSKGVNIIHTNAKKFDAGRVYSPVEAEAIALKRAIDECHYWIYYADPIMLFSDCSGLLDMMKKPMADIENGKIRKIMEKVQNYHWETIHIPAEENEMVSPYLTYRHLTCRIEFHNNTLFPTFDLRFTVGQISDACNITTDI